MRQPKYYWEDFRPGDVAELGEKTVRKEEIIEFASEFDPQPFHLDEEAAAKTVFSGIISSGWLTSLIWLRLMHKNLLSYLFL